MKLPMTCPDPAELRALVDGQVRAEERIAEHLEGCPGCQRRLEDMAADSDVWRRARSHLRTVDTRPEVALERVVARLETGGPATPSAANTIELPALDFLEPSDQPGCLGRLAHYAVQEVIGRGGMGVVLKAFDERLQRTVAIKLLATRDTTDRQRFVREAQAMAATHHEHVIEVYAVDDSGVPFIVMEHLVGRSLQERLDHDGPPGLAETVRIGMETALGLAAAHAQGLVHRDVKPANILVEETTGKVKLTDFGLAKHADEAGWNHSGEVAGTPPYMAPEQARGDAVDHRADLFSLGSVLYALCTGEAPFAGTSGTTAVLREVHQGAPRPVRDLNPQVPQWLAAIIAKLHAKDPALRFQSAAQVADLLSRGQAGSASRPGRRGVSPTLMAGPRRAVSRTVLAAVVLLLSGAAAYLAGPTVYRFATNQGQLIIETADADVEVQAKGPEVTILDTKTQRAVTLKAGQYQLELVAGPPGLRLIATEFTLERGGTQIARIRLEPGVTAAEIRRFGHEGIAHAVAFADEGRRVFSGGWDNTARLWDLETGGEVHRFDLLEEGKNHAVICVAVSPDGRHGLAGTRHGTVWLVDLQKGKVLRRCDYPRTPELGTHGITRMAFSPDGGHALLGSYDGIVRVWDVGQWKELRRIRHEEQGLWGVDVSRDGRYALTAGGLGGRGVVRLWDLKTQESIRRLDGHTAGVWQAVFSRDGRTILSAGGDNTMRLWEAATGKELRSFAHADQVRDVTFAADGHLALSACVDGIVRLWDVKTGRELHRYTGHGVEVNAVACAPDNRRVISGGADKTVRVWELPKANRIPMATPAPPRPRTHPPRVLCVLASKDFFYPDYISVKSELTRNGIRFVAASWAAGEAVPDDVTGRGEGEPVPVEVLLQEARADDYDAIYFCGGKGAMDYAEGGAHAAEARRLIAEAQAAGRIIAAMGTGPVIVAEAGVLRGRRATCYKYGQLPGEYIRRLERAGASWVDEPFVVSGAFITGQNPEHIREFARALGEMVLK